jgi:alkanesulfonate monooxygenase SsuD/methylene tetrahydromethanopterin reductase-like flavin-dependent oxidoreductase (luciferase family)
MLRQAGVSTEEIALVKDNVERFGLARAASEIDDALVRKVAIAGTPEQVIAGLRQFFGVGLKLPVIWEIIGANRQHSLRLIAKEVMPKVVQKKI